METKKQPVKRNENLVKFSHEHHHGLVFAMRLKKSGSLEKNTLRRFVREFWEDYLEDHFRHEEKLLLQLISNEETKIKFLSDHQKIQSTVNFLLNSNVDLQKAALDLAQLVNDHIRFEERVMFPQIEKVSTKKELEYIGKELVDIEPHAHHFEPEFWKQ